MSFVRRNLRRQVPDLLALLTDDTAASRYAAILRTRAEVVVVGSGSSFVAAAQVAVMLQAAAVPAGAAEAGALAHHPDSTAPVLVFSHSGKLVETVRQLRPSAPVISVGSQESGADIVTGPRERGGVATTGHTAALVRGAQLANCLGADLPLSAAVAAIPALSFENLAPVGLGRSGVDFVAAAADQFSAHEGALKMRECARLPASHWTLESYRHGAFASIDGSQALILLGEDPEMPALARAAEQLGCEVHRLTFHSDQPLGPLRCLPLTVLAHRLAYASAKVRGRHPDSLGADDPLRAAAWRTVRGGLAPSSADSRD